MPWRPLTSRGEWLSLAVVHATMAVAAAFFVDSEELRVVAVITLVCISVVEMLIGLVTQPQRD